MSATSAGLMIAQRVNQDAEVATIKKAPAAEKDAKKQALLEQAEADRKGAFATLAAYIPSEAITLYIAGVAAIQTTELKTQPLALYVVLAASVVLTVVLTLVSYSNAVTKKNPFVAWKIWWQIIITVAAFALYVVSIPLYEGSPITWPQAWGALIAIIAAALLPLLAKVVGLTPKNPTKVEEATA